MDQPLVSVICLCYNHAKFVTEAIQSALDQSYKNIQLIVVDDASQDASASVINELCRQHPVIQSILLKKNVGNCKAFNQGLTLVKGDFIVDLAADDVMMPDRIEKQIQFFSALTADYGVVFTDAQYVDRNGKFIRNHFDYLFEKGLLLEVPQGDVYRDVVSRYFIPSPTMLIKKEVMDKLNGYDENLAYEDFDFWVRSSRTFKYGFLNERLTKIRKTGNSMSSGWYKRGDKQLHSTYLVCEKARKLSLSKEDNDALIERVRYELRQSCFSGNFVEGELFYGLLRELTLPVLSDRILFVMMKLKLPLRFFRRAYQTLRFGRSGLLP